MFMRVMKHKIVFFIVCIIIVNSGMVSAQDWPQWLGANRDAKVSGFKAPQTWPDKLTEKWLQYDPYMDILPSPNGDNIINLLEYELLSESWNP